MSKVKVNIHSFRKKKGKVESRHDDDIGFFNWHLSKHYVESLLRYGDVYHAFDLCLADRKSTHKGDKANAVCV